MFPAQRVVAAKPPRRVAASSFVKTIEYPIEGDRVICVNRANRFASKSRWTRGSTAKMMPWPPHAASRAAAYEEKPRRRFATFGLTFSDRRTRSHASSLTVGLSRFCVDHHDASSGSAPATTEGAAASTNFVFKIGVSVRFAWGSAPQADRGDLIRTEEIPLRIRDVKRDRVGVAPF